MPWIGTPDDEQIFKGHPACAGCGMALGVRHLLQVSGDDTVLVIPASCASVMQGVYPYTSTDIPVVHTAFAAAPSTASGIRMSYERQDEDANVVVLAGDGATTDIGLASLSGTLERDDDILYVLYDNEAYSNTGFQKSGRTPQGARTTTTPTGRVGAQKDVAEIVAAHDPAFMATASPAFLNDLRRKVEQGLDAEGTAFLHLHSPCPPGWRIDASETVEVAKLAVASGIWVLYERERGGDYQINQPSKAAFRNPDEVDDYLEAQGRFSTAKDGDVEAMRAQARRNIEHFSAYLEAEVASQ
ncbi:MAG: thiamine pyrophosphate-dependent enzyme [Halodesulfurarchaeum sp.]